MSKMHTFFGFKDGKLVSVLHTLDENVTNAVDCTYFIGEPRDGDKQIEQWKKVNK
jgi:hypothetical protein